MPELIPPNPADAGIEARTYFVRSRNVMLARAKLTDLYLDYYLHAADQNLKVAPEQAELFKQALAGFTLHCASRPWNELLAWTINFQDPRVNIFLTGDNGTGAITGRIFTENVRELPENIFYSDVVCGTEPKRRSAVTFTGTDPLAAAEKFYAQSEQRLARIFALPDEDFVMLVEHPDCDKAWLESLDAKAVVELDEKEKLTLLERRVQRWHCGCNERRMLEVLAPTMRQDAAGLFGADQKIEIRCPRCGARYAITREAMEAFVAEKS